MTDNASLPDLEFTYVTWMPGDAEFGYLWRYHAAQLNNAAFRMNREIPDTTGEYLTTDHTPLTPSEWVIVMMLCRFNDPFPGPNAWMHRRAWLAYATRRPFDPEAELDEHMQYLSDTERRDMLERIDLLRRLADKSPLWPFPADAFDPTSWFELLTEQSASDQ